MYSYPAAEGWLPVARVVVETLEEAMKFLGTESGWRRSGGVSLTMSSEVSVMSGAMETCVTAFLRSRTSPSLIRSEHFTFGFRGRLRPAGGRRLCWGVHSDSDRPRKSRKAKPSDSLDSS